MPGIVALLSVVVGVILFVAGDVLWLVRHSLGRPMDLRVTGGLVGGGVALIAIGITGAVLG